MIYFLNGVVGGMLTAILAEAGETSFYAFLFGVGMSVVLMLLQALSVYQFTNPITKP